MATETIERRREGDLLDDAERQDTSGSLPVPDLQVTGFRGLKDLTVSRLGRVTLIAGKNGVGKTTLLEAVQVFAARFSVRALEDILGKRREIIVGIDEDGDPTVDYVWESLFWGRHADSGQTITIGSDGAEVKLRISVAMFDDIERDNPEIFLGRMSENTLVFKIETDKGPYKYVSSVTGPARRYGERIQPWENGFPEDLQFRTLGPDVVRDVELAELWDELIDSGGSKKEVLDSLSLMYDHQVDDLDMVGDSSPFVRTGRRAKVRLAGHVRPVPLKSLGDGAVRIVGYLAAVSRANRSLVLVDEIENGIHHTIQPLFWETLINAAARYDSQIVATTHSWDCVEAFARAAAEKDSADCSLIRLDDVDSELLVAHYDEENLLNAAESKIEVR